MDMEGFLDPIPEDTSLVAGSQHAANLSTVSAVASSDSGGMNAPSANYNTKKQRGKLRWKRDGKGTNASGMSEGTAIDDNLSDANASLGGAALDVARPTAPSEGRIKVEDTSKSVLLSPNCKKFLGVVAILAVAIGIGMYFILRPVTEEGEDVAALNDNFSPSATLDPNFSPFEVNYATPSPTPQPYSPGEVKILDDIFLRVSGTTKANMFDLNTSEGKGRAWMIHSDAIMNLEDEQHMQQRYILCVLYFATNGVFWKKKTNWLSAGRSECDWYGVTCNVESNIIERIDISTNNVTGTLPNEITSLSNLVTFNMSHGNIAGNIPEETFDSLNYLESLDLQENQIVGTIPSSSSSESGLKLLNLGSNKFTGLFPFFPNAISISFDANNLTSFDDRYSSSSTSLMEFRGFHNRLLGPLPNTWDAPNLIELDFGYNFLSGTIPQDLWNLPSLKSLLLDHCNLTGPVPSYSESDALHRLWLDSNQLSGNLPTGFGFNWTQLYSVKLQDNLFEGSITPEQCNRWDATEPFDDTNETNGIDSSRERPSWKLYADCEVDCACCTNGNCVRPNPANINVRR